MELMGCYEGYGGYSGSINGNFMSVIISWIYSIIVQFWG